MAVAVPMLMAATGASAAVGAAIGVSATIVTAATGVLVGATSIGSKINKAASKVFGKDVVNFANIAGSVFMATGGDPANLFGGGSGAAAAGANAAGGALSAAGGALAEPFAAGAEALSSAAAPSFDTSGMFGGAADAASTMLPPPNVFGAQPPGFQVGSVLNNGPAAMDPRVPPVSQPGGMPGGGALKTASEWWSRQTDPVKSALIQVGGQTLAGTAQGVSKAREMKDLREERLRREAIFNSGSRLNAAYGPRAPVVRGG